MQTKTALRLGTGAAFDASYDDFFLTATAAAEIRTGQSQLATSAFYGMRAASMVFDKHLEPATAGVSPCDIAQTERFNRLRRGLGDVDAGFARGSAKQRGATLRGRAGGKSTVNIDALPSFAVDPLNDAAATRDSGVRNVRDLRDYLAGRVVVDGNLPLPAPTVDLSLIIRDLPDRQRDVAERLMAGDTAADIARDRGVDPTAIRNLTRKIRAALLAADPTVAAGR